jgi:N-acylneuraminate cytidylyltransferase
MKPNHVKINNRITGSNSSAIILNELEAHDIDNEKDWKIAEKKFSMLVK